MQKNYCYRIAAKQKVLWSKSLDSCCWDIHGGASAGVFQRLELSQSYVNGACKRSHIVPLYLYEVVNFIWQKWLILLNIFEGNVSL